MKPAGALPNTVLDAFPGLLVIGLVLGTLFGADVLSGVALTWIVLAGVAIFVPWAVLQLDPAGLRRPPASDDDE